MPVFAFKKLACEISDEIRELDHRVANGVPRIVKFDNPLQPSHIRNLIAPVVGQPVDLVLVYVLLVQYDHSASGRTKSLTHVAFDVRHQIVETELVG
jgi:hypothetical protein